MKKMRQKGQRNDQMFTYMDRGDQHSHFEEGLIDLNRRTHGDLLTDKLLVTSASFLKARQRAALATRVYSVGAGRACTL